MIYLWKCFIAFAIEYPTLAFVIDIYILTIALVLTVGFLAARK